MIYKINYDLNHELIIDIVNSFKIVEIGESEIDVYEYTTPEGVNLSAQNRQFAIKSLTHIIKLYKTSFKSINSNLKQVKSKLQHKYPVKINLSIGFEPTYIELAMIFVKSSFRNKGIATSVMNELIEFANTEKINIRLLPSNIFGSDLLKLIEFYQRFGFKFLDNSTHMQYDYKEII